MLAVRWGACSSGGIKSINQDCQSLTVPDFSVLVRRGIVACVADGISSSQVSQYASELAVTRFNRDYLLTSENWSSARAATKVLATINTALYLKTAHSPYQGNPDRGYVCTFSALVLHGQRAVVLHCGDSVVLHRRGNTITPLTEPHTEQSDSGVRYLSNALGIKPELDVDVHQLDILPGDQFALMTDGAADFIDHKTLFMGLPTHGDNLNAYCDQLVEQALVAGSKDNITIQLIDIVNVSNQSQPQYDEQGFLPRVGQLDVGKVVDQWELINCLHRSDRSEVFVAQHQTTCTRAMLKVPAVSQRHNSGFLDDMAKEVWVANRIDNPHVMKAHAQHTGQSQFYTLTEFIEGKTLQQHLLDTGPAPLQQIRSWANELVDGLTAMHRKGILHQDLRPENVLLSNTGKLVIIDFGSASVNGHHFLDSSEQWVIPGDLLYSAPEYFVGQWASEQADQFSLVTILYYALCGDYPFGTSVAKISRYSDLHKLRYRRLLSRDADVPAWVDETLKRGCHPNAAKRYPSLSELLYDLHHPNPAYQQVLPWSERNPVKFWQTVSAILATLLILSYAR